MATSETRRRLFVRSEPEHPLTPRKVAALRVVAELGLATVPQVCGFLASSERAVRAHLLDLYHMGLADRIGVPRAALAGEGATDASLLFGRAPVIYALTRPGARLLDVPYRPMPYGPRNSLFVAHEVFVRDGRVFLEVIARRHGHAVALWRTGVEVGPARPDAAFVYEMAGARIVGLLEADRGTENSKRWIDKHARYVRAFGGTALRDALGHSRARVVVVAPDARRRDAIAGILAGRGLEDRFWIAERSALGRADLAEAAWRVPGRAELQPLVPGRFLQGTDADQEEPGRCEEGD